MHKSNETHPNDLGVLHEELKVMLLPDKVGCSSKPPQERDMASNSQESIQDIRGQFEHMLDFVTGEQARTAPAAHIERGLFKMVLSLGAKMLQMFFIMRTQTSFP